jgi:hypothetical protein
MGIEKKKESEDAQRWVLGQVRRGYKGGVVQIGWV